MRYFFKTVMPFNHDIIFTSNDIIMYERSMREVLHVHSGTERFDMIIVFSRVLYTASFSLNIG